MSKRSEYRDRLRTLETWDDYLLEHSGLPGPRANLELLQAVADEGTAKLIRRYLTWTADRAPVNSPQEFLACCGVVGLGRLLAEGSARPLRVLRAHAADPRWRVREVVAMALQRLGDVDCPACWPSLPIGLRERRWSSALRWPRSASPGCSAGPTMREPC